MMWGYGSDGGMMGWGYGALGISNMILWIVFVGLVVAAVAWLVRRLPLDAHQSYGRRSPGLDALEERYARGEIDRDEFLQKKQDISPDLTRSARH
ncbi:SHOCT domain-containing protein [Bradyrhizobium guangxiense]